MIKSELNQVKKNKYPYIGVDEYENVVLFTEEDTGTRLKASFKCPEEPIGEFSSSWGEQSFIPLEGSITLTNH
jgi:hypothetical protein